MLDYRKEYTVLFKKYLFSHTGILKLFKMIIQLLYIFMLVHSIKSSMHAKCLKPEELAFVFMKTTIKHFQIFCNMWRIVEPSKWFSSWLHLCTSSYYLPLPPLSPPFQTHSDIITFSTSVEANWNFHIQVRSCRIYLSVPSSFHLT